ncbi:hypothetical protein P872_10890 [Rhodonellum psychrophilum GCM71 = DSM 17998]|uniref:Uncharacterized protein n=2 Tax=Rhodonellum TaxID=336827 RepID=U5BYH5_9BACT|nr:MULTISPECIES: hypothetical protein [Rhodonellum]ERM80947.1 hypothetical protein P872_10890 [Rhodonellum psychrophilum GCM71 = DSM 17998]MDO9554754.1 hypothetical protein [Rhodonellum sp.]SDY82647.1 hypothetical protein SAMN05444412_10351 [Rhodonellum ikkaensis]
MRKVNYWLASALVGFSVALSSCDREDGPEPIMDDSFYSTKLGGETRVADPMNSGQMIEQGFLNLRTVVTNTVVTIATNEGGKYDALQPYFSVLLSEVGRGETSGLNHLVMEFSEFLAQATGSKNFSYTGLSMADAHNPALHSRMNGTINNADYDLFIGAVVEGAAQAGITSADVIGPVGQLLESVRQPIVQRADGASLDLYSRLGGSGLVADPDNEGQLIEAGYIPLRAVVTGTVLIIATNEGGKYNSLQPYFSVLLAEVGAGNTSGFTMLVSDFSDLLAESIGSQNIEYNGLNMVDAHNPATNPRMTGLITSADYDLFIQAVVEAAVELNVPTSVIGEFGGLLTSPGLKGAIVQG